MGEERIYTNPVFGDYMADPFVLKYNGEYYAYGTKVVGGCMIPVLHSTDLVHWRDLGEALELPVQGPECYWAPEVAYANGTFFMYYSAGGQEGEGHQLRVATATQPAGPFRDQGTILTPDDPFTIDAHPFRDDDGTWYLFYSRDFLEGDRVGTGIVVDRLIDMVELAGERTAVVRPHADWQLYQRQREWYNRVWDWFTIEGAFVRKHADRYYCFWSGGSWKAPNYGVGYAVADHPLGPWNVGSSIAGPALLRTIPDQILGPGHVSVTLGPDNLQEYMVYHAWDPAHTGRLMRIDALHWPGGAPSVAGPTYTPQAAPPMPLFRDLFDGPDRTLDVAGWEVLSGTWCQENGEARQLDRSAAPAVALLRTATPPKDYLLEVNARPMHAAPGGTAGLYAAYLDAGTYVELDLEVGRLAAHWRVMVEGAAHHSRVIDLRQPAQNPEWNAYRQILLQRRGGVAELRIDGVLIADDLPVPLGASRVGIVTREGAAAFDGVTLSRLEQRG